MGTSWWGGVTYYFEVAFDDAPTVAVGSCTWTDLSAYVRSWSTNRGRSDDLGDMSVGTATIVLDNIGANGRTGRLFDPSNTAGAYYGKLLPMKRVRIREVIGATSTTLFTGYTQVWQLSYPSDGRDSTVVLQAVDATYVLSLAAQPASAYHRQVVADSPTYYWPLQTTNTAVDGLIDDIAGAELARYRSSDLLDPVTSFTLPLGESVAQETGYAAYVNSGLTTLPGAVELWFHNQDSLIYSQALVKYNCGNAKYGDLYYGTFVYVNVVEQTLYVKYNDKAASKANVSDMDAAGSLPGYTNCGPLSTGSRHIVVVPSTTKVDVYVDGQLRRSIATQALTSESVDAKKYISAFCFGSYAVSHLSTYTSALTATQIADHYSAGVFAFGHPYGERAGARIGRVLDAIGWPAGDRALSTGDTPLDSWLPGGSSALSECHDCESADQGIMFISADGKVTYRDRQWQWTNSRATTAQATFGDSGTEIRYDDTLTIDGRPIGYVRNVVNVTYGGNESVSARDATSVAAYFPQSESISAGLISEKYAFTAKQLAAYRLRQRKTPVDRVPSLTVRARRDTTYLSTLNQLELGDRVVVKRRPTGGSGTMSITCTVQGIRHDGDRQGRTVSFYLAPAPPSYTEAPYLTLGDATYGKIGAAAGNLIPY